MPSSLFPHPEERCAASRLEGRTRDHAACVSRRAGILIVQKHQKHREPSQRQLRVGEELRHALSRILQRGALRDPALQGVAVTVTEVRISPDLKNATAYVMPLGGVGREAVLEGLARSAGYLRGQIAREVPLRFTPGLAFALDTSFDHASRINELLHRPEVERDLNGDADEGDGDGDG
jgi:ribosome-binding factor A